MAGSGGLSTRSLSREDAHLNEEVPQSLSAPRFPRPMSSPTHLAHWPGEAASTAFMECQPVEYVSADQLSPGLADWTVPQGELDLLRVKAAARIFSSAADGSDDARSPTEASREAQTREAQVRAMAEWSAANGAQRSSSAPTRPAATAVRSQIERAGSSSLYSKQSSITEEVAGSIPGEITHAAVRPLPVTEMERSSLICRRATIVLGYPYGRHQATPELPVTEDERRQVLISRPMIICRQPKSAVSPTKTAVSPTKTAVSPSKPAVSPTGSSTWANSSELPSPRTPTAAATQPSRLASATLGARASPVTAPPARFTSGVTRPNSIPAGATTIVSTAASKPAAVPASPVSSMASRSEMSIEPSVSFALSAAPPVASSSASSLTKLASSSSARLPEAQPFEEWSPSSAAKLASLPVTDCEKSDVLHIRPTIVVFSADAHSAHIGLTHGLSELELQLQAQRPQALPTATSVAFQELDPHLLQRPHGRALFQIIHSKVTPPPEMPRPAMTDFVISRRLLAVSDA